MPMRALLSVQEATQREIPMLRGACTSFAACLASLGLSVVAVTAWLQLVATGLAVVSGVLSVTLLALQVLIKWREWRKVRAG